MGGKRDSAGQRGDWGRAELLVRAGLGRTSQSAFPAKAFADSTAGARCCVDVAEPDYCSARIGLTRLGRRSYPPAASMLRWMIAYDRVGRQECPPHMERRRGKNN